MPRAVQSKESQILDFFRTAPLVVAVLVLNLAREAVKARGATKTPAKPKVAPAPAAVVPAKTAKAKKRVRQRQAASTANDRRATDAQVEDLGGEQG